MKKEILILLLFLIWPSYRTFCQEHRVGLVKGTRGLVSIMRGGRTIPAFPYQKLFLKDVIMTGSDGAIGIMLEDNTLLSMGPISRLALDKFNFAPAENKYALRLKMHQGSFVYLSGLLGKLAPHAVELDTPAGKISMLKESNFMANFPSEQHNSQGGEP